MFDISPGIGIACVIVQLIAVFMLGFFVGCWKTWSLVIGAIVWLIGDVICLISVSIGSTSSVNITTLVLSLVIAILLWTLVFSLGYISGCLVWLYERSDRYMKRALFNYVEHEFGHECSDYEPHCACCNAWHAYYYLTDRDRVHWINFHDESKRSWVIRGKAPVYDSDWNPTMHRKKRQKTNSTTQYLNRSRPYVTRLCDVCVKLDDKKEPCTRHVFKKIGNVYQCTNCNENYRWYVCHTDQYTKSEKTDG